MMFQVGEHYASTTFKIASLRYMLAPRYVFLQRLKAFGII